MKDKKHNVIRNCCIQMRKGVNFIEIILVVAIIGILAAVGIKLFSPLPSMLDTGKTEFDLQTSVKSASETIVNKVRYSTAVFIIPEKSFNKDKTKGWDYIGIENVTVNGLNRKEVVQYTYNGTDGTNGPTHDRTVLVEAQEDLIYNLEFSKKVNADKLIDLIFEAETADKSNDGRKMEIDTSVEALNALQLIDHSTVTDIGRAIAYSSGDRDYAIDNGIAPGRISMILDVSGSMGDQFSPTDSETRISKLKTVTSTLLDQFYDSGAAFNINFIPFANEANDTSAEYHKFKNIRNDFDTLKTLVRDLGASGGTNTGDGIRRSYHSLLNAAGSDTEPMPNYVILVVDGESNFYTHSSTYPYPFIFTDGNAVKNRYFWWWESKPPIVYSQDSNYTKRANDYVNEMGKYLVNNLTAHPMVSELRCFLVAVDMNSSSQGLITIKNALNIAEGDDFLANSDIDLQEAFTVITKKIIEDSWFIYGPNID